MSDVYPLESKCFYEFRNFCLDTGERVLLRDDKRLPVTPKVFHLLKFLIENRGRVVEKEELMREIWAESFVEEGNLAFTVRQLRKALDDDARQPGFVETVPRRGYRFIAEVKEVSTGDFHEQANLKKLSSDGSVAKPNSEISPAGISSGQIAAKTSLSSSVRSRPVFYSMVVVLTGIFLLTGFFVLKNQPSILQRFKTSADSNAGFLRVEKLTDTGDADSVSISPDGKLLAYFTVEGGKNTIWLRQFATGKSVPVISSSEETFNGLNFSRDGEYIVYFHQRKDEPTHLSRVSILGGTPTRILNEIHGSHSFSPDDRRIAFTRIDESGSSIIVADADGQNERRVFLSPKPRYIFSVDWSPDGKSIAFIAGIGEYNRGKDFGVMELDLEGETEKSLTDFKWSNLETVSWLPDKSGLLVTGREKWGETDQIWRVSLPDGRAERITDDSNSLIFRGASADFSRIIATQEYLNTSVYIAPSNDLSDARPIAKAQGDAAWTPGGEIIFTTKDTIKTDIWLMSADGGDKKQLTANDALERYAAASPDGRFIAFVSNRSGRQNIWRMDADGGNPAQLTNGEGETYPIFTSDSRFVVFNSSGDGSLWRIPVEGGEIARLSEEKSNRVSISPDGGKYVYYGRRENKRKLLVKSFPDGTLVREFDVFINSGSAPKIVWASDGKSLIYENTDLNFAGNLWRQSLDGGEPRQLTNFTSEKIFDFGFSPDGNRLALVRGSWNSDAVLLKGFK